MPKTIDYPRTSYASAWEVAEVVDDTGGKCSIEACARKLDRKVSGSFKAILGSAVKFGLLTSKRELLTTTNLFRRIKHAYDKQEELLYHREAFLHPPLFSQISRKFRNRELPVQMFDIMLIREFGVEEINAQNVAKAFVDGARMSGILDERNVIADIDQLAAQQGPRRELASGEMPLNLFKESKEFDPTVSAGSSTPSETSSLTQAHSKPTLLDSTDPLSFESLSSRSVLVPSQTLTTDVVESDPVSNLFGLTKNIPPQSTRIPNTSPVIIEPIVRPSAVANQLNEATTSDVTHSPTDRQLTKSTTPPTNGYILHISGPGLDTQLEIQDIDDLEIVRILLDKIKKKIINR